MSTVHHTSAGNPAARLFSRLQAFRLRHPGWWIYLLCLAAWTILFMTSHSGPDQPNRPGPLVLCMTGGSIQSTSLPAMDIPPGNTMLQNAAAAIASGILPWILMVMAMMFPMVNDPVRHVFYSVRRKDRHAGVLSFLLGYGLAWTAAGAIFLLLPLLATAITGKLHHTVSTIISASGFLAAALVAWLPTRPAQLTQCSQTMPIRIRRPQLYTDSFRYGLKMASVCLAMCWAVMAGLLLAQHTLLLMYTATVILFFERYLLPHTSKLPALAWLAMAIVVFAMGF